MAPEYPPVLVVFDARFEGNELMGTLEYVETADPLRLRRLRVRWNVRSVPDGYLSVGKGVAHVYDKDIAIMPGSEDASAYKVDDSRYLFSEGLHFGDQLMFILILPTGHTLHHPTPKPVGTKLFDERIALYWILAGDPLRRTSVECTIKPLKIAVDTEILRINREFLTSVVPLDNPVEDTDTASLASPPLVPDKREPSRPVKILFLAANPKDTDPLRLGEEVRNIDGALRRADHGDKFDLEQQWAVRVGDLQDHFLRYNPEIVHFSGHGSAVSEIILEDVSGFSQVVSPRALGNLFHTLKDNIRCVVLNACYSEAQAQAIAEHIDCVVGMSKAIGDEAAISFAVAFYRALGYGRDVKTAFNLGIGQIDLEGLEEQDTPRLLALRKSPKEVVFVNNPWGQEWRRTFVSDLLEAGADIAIVSRMAGHSNVQTTARYTKTSEQDLEGAAHRLEVEEA